MNFKKIVLLILLTAITGWSYAQPRLEVSPKEHNFGTIIAQNGSVSRVFKVTNTGTTPLVILSADVACKCTKVEYPKKPIAAGESKEIKVTYDPKGEKGSFLKTIHLLTNGTEKERVVTIKGSVQ